MPAYEALLFQIWEVGKIKIIYASVKKKDSSHLFEFINDLLNSSIKDCAYCFKQNKNDLGKSLFWRLYSSNAGGRMGRKDKKVK